MSEIEFNQYFNNQLNELSLNLNEMEYLEKVLLYLNRMRCELGSEKKNEFFLFLNEIFFKIKQELKNDQNTLQNANNLLKPLVELVDAVNYQFLTFSTAFEIVKKHEIKNWPQKIFEIKKKFFDLSDSSNRSIEELVDLVIKNNKCSSISENDLRKMSKEASRIKLEAQMLIKRDRLSIESGKVCERKFESSGENIIVWLVRC